MRPGGGGSWPPRAGMANGGGGGNICIPFGILNPVGNGGIGGIDNPFRRGGIGGFESIGGNAKPATGIMFGFDDGP